MGTAATDSPVTEYAEIVDELPYLLLNICMLIYLEMAAALSPEGKALESRWLELSQDGKGASLFNFYA